MDALHAARELVPWWVRSGALSFAALPFGIAFALALLAVAATRVRVGVARSAHWTLRARALAPSRQVALLAAWASGALFAAFVGVRENLFVAAPAGVVSLLAGVSAWIGASSAGWLLLRGAVDEPPSWPASVGGQLLWLLVFFPHALVLVVMSCTVHGRLEAANVAAAALGTAAYAAACIWAGLPIARALGLLRAPSQRIAAAVARASARTGVAPRRVWELRMRLANAFAVPLPGWVVFTTRTAEVLGDDELEAVAAHELAHLSEPRRVLAARLAAPVALLPFGFGRVLYDALGAWGGLAVGYALVFGVAFGMRKLARRMEERADGVARSGEAAPGTYAAALERIYASHLVPAVSGRRAPTHPDLYDRLIAAGVAPAYPRPLPPSRRRSLAGAAVLAAGVAIAGLGYALPGLLLRPMLSDTESRTMASIAITGGDRSDLFRLAQARADAGRLAEASSAAALAVALWPQNPEALALHSWTLTLQGRCSDAAEVLARAVDGRFARSDEGSPWIEFAARALGRCREDST